MTRIVVAYILGAVAASYYPPDQAGRLGVLIVASGLALCVAARCSRWPSAKAVLRWAGTGALAAGIAATLWHASGARYLDRRAQLALADTVQATVTVSAFPTVGDDSIRFVGLVDSAAAPLKKGDRIQLSWFQTTQSPAAGERWQMDLRLRALRGTANPAGFDVERWGFLQRIHARGLVVRGQRVQSATGLSAWRDRISTWLMDPTEPSSGLLSALAVGDRRWLEPQQWAALQATGTSHLMAISGLHIGLVATSTALVLQWLLWLAARTGSSQLPMLLLRCRPYLIWAAAAGYAALAGFALPTQRALLMLTCVLLAFALRRSNVAPAGLAVSALVISVVDPFAPLRSGFWLSFTAVTLLLLALAGQPRSVHWWRVALRTQIAIGVGLLPLLFMLGLPASPWAIPVNLLAIPWVSFMVLPPLLVSVLLSTVAPAAAELLLQWPQWSLRMLWELLSVLGRGDGFLPPALRQADYWLLTLSVLLVVLLPRGVPGRGLGCCLALVFTLNQWSRALEQSNHDLFDGDLLLHVLDVGQGLAVAIETRHQLLLYDTGPASRSGWNAGEAIVRPVLERAIGRVPNWVMVSHGDADHAGGVQYLRRHWSRAHWLITDPSSRGTRCLSGTRWMVDTIDFSVLHPGPGLPYLGNDSSCVLLIETGKSRVLLPGDISDAVEARLLRQGLTQVDLVVLPHHGSKSSSSAAFVDAIDSRWGVVSAGANNRFEMPHAPVVHRYLNAGTTLLNTAQTGYLQFAVNRKGVSLVHIERRDSNRYWHWPFD